MQRDHGDRDALTYCKRAKLVSIYISPIGRIRIGPDPIRDGALGAWWAKTDDAARVAELARKIAKRLPAPAAIVRAAHQLEIPLTNHATAMARAHAAVARLEARTRAASDNGELSAFHQEYKRRRLEAKAVGRRFMSYKQARARLRTLLEQTAERRGARQRHERGVRRAVTLSTSDFGRGGRARAQREARTDS